MLMQFCRVPFGFFQIKVRMRKMMLSIVLLFWLQCIEVALHGALVSTAAAAVEVVGVW